MKLAILAILLLALAEAEASYRESCRMEMSQQSLNKCRSFLRSGSKAEGDDCDSVEVPRMCCEQLGQVRRDCRCDVIKHMMQEIMEEEGQQECGGQCGEMMMMRAKYLPAMCSMHPFTCRIRSGSSGRSIGMVV